MDYSAVPFDASAAGMLTVGEVRAALAETEPLDGVTFWTGEPGTEVTYGKGWFEGELTAPAPVWLTLPDRRVFQLTRQAAQQLGSTAKANKKYQVFLPHEMLSAQVTWALTEGLRKKSGDGIELKLHVAGVGRGPAKPDGSEPDEVPLAVAQSRATIVPFSNTRLLDIAVLTVQAKLGNAAAERALVDYKFFNDREHTSFRVVVPAVQQVITGTGAEDDAWCYGIEVSNSMTGAKQTTVSGYLFRLATTAGVTDVEHSAGGFNRRGSAPADVYAWAAEAAEDILGGVEEAFTGLQVLTASEVDGEYGRVLEQLYRDSPVSAELKLRIADDLEQRPGTLTMYDLADAAAAAANLDGSSWREVRSLHDLAGHIVHQGGGMCRGQLPDGCRRLLDKDRGV